MRPQTGIPRSRLIDGVFFLIIAAAAFSLKSFYSHAGSEDLNWILRPTAIAVEAISGIGFGTEAGAGYVSDDRRFVIAPACAGVNFLIIAFVMAGCSGIRRFQGRIGKSVWIGIGAISAFGCTVAVNSARVVLSIRLFEAGVHIGPLTPDRLHRIEGVVVYLVFLYLYHGAISMALNKWTARETFQRRGSSRWSSPANLWPLFCYLSVALGVPLLNAAYRRSPGRFVEHSAMVLVMSVAVFVAILAVQRGCQRIRKRLRSVSKETT